MSLIVNVNTVTLIWIQLNNLLMRLLKCSFSTFVVC